MNLEKSIITAYQGPVEQLQIILGFKRLTLKKFNIKNGQWREEINKTALQK